MHIVLSFQVTINSNNNNNNNHKRTGGLGNKKTGRDYPDYNIVEIGQNTTKSPGDLSRLAVTQNPEEDNQLTLVGKTLERKK